MWWVLAVGTLFAQDQWPKQFVGEWAHPMDQQDGADTVVLSFHGNGTYDKYVIHVRETFDGPKTSMRDTLRSNLRWQVRHRPDSEHSSAHDEICLEWRGDVSCGWVQFLQGDLWIGAGQLKRRRH